MTEIYDEIKSYIALIDPDLLEVEDKLDFYIEDVVDRVLVYTNRQQLIDEGVDLAEVIPARIRKGIASMVSQFYRTMQSSIEGSKEVTSVADHGQKVSFSNEIRSSFIGTEDKEIFGSFASTLNNFRLPTIVENI